MSVNTNRLPIGTRVEFVVPHPVASSKNRRRIFARGRRVVSLPSAQAQQDTASVRSIARQAAGGLMFHALDALQLDYIHDISTDCVRIAVTKVGELPAKGKRGTVRDIHGMAETIADALQDVLYPDDRSVDVLTCGRKR